LSLEGSETPQFKIKVYYYEDGRPFGDTFMYNGRQYAAKQPGQFMAGAVVYFFCDCLASLILAITRLRQLWSHSSLVRSRALRRRSLFSHRPIVHWRQKPCVAVSERNVLCLWHDCIRLFGIRLPRHARFSILVIAGYLIMLLAHQLSE